MIDNRLQPNDEYAHGGIILYGLDGRVPEESKDKVNKQLKK